MANDVFQILMCIVFLKATLDFAAVIDERSVLIWGLSLFKLYIKWQETQQSTSKIISPERYANFAKCSALSTEIKMDVKISLRWTFFLRKKVLTKIVDSKLLKSCSLNVITIVMAKSTSKHLLNTTSTQRINWLIERLNWNREFWRQTRRCKSTNKCYRKPKTKDSPLAQHF